MDAVSKERPAGTVSMLTSEPPELRMDRKALSSPGGRRADLVGL
jgi:hypothetical protein